MALVAGHCRCRLVRARGRTGFVARRPRARVTNQFRESLNRAQLDGLLASGRLGKGVYLEPQLFERAEYLRAALDEMRRIYGSFQNYLHQALGISDEQLEQIRENLL